MMCPSCGPAGKMEQIGFSPESEHFYCHHCQVTYVAYQTGHGTLGEPVPLSNRKPSKNDGKADREKNV